MVDPPQMRQGIRKKFGKNKKSKRPAAAAAVKREEAIRKVTRSRSGSL